MGRAASPVGWLTFLGTIWGGETADEKKSAAEMISTLQEVFGYLLSDDTRQQKAFLLVGPKRVRRRQQFGAVPAQKNRRTLLQWLR